jgi:UDP-N-acetylglucosamine--dolichyl-phosphate N-acetylglucosaminephosphotransferase
MSGKDMNKVGNPEVAEMGGVAVVLAFFAGVVALIVADAALPGALIPDPRLLLAALIAALGCAFVGAIDDLFDLRQRVKAILPIVFAVPLGAYLPDAAVHLPRGGIIELGLLMIPVIAFMVSAGANAANMLEGFNGLGAGLGLIMSGTLIVLSILTPHSEALVLLVPFFAATAGFFIFNRFPAKVFPGDTFTLFMGGTLVSAAVIMGFKEVGAILFTPMIVEFLMKARGRFRDESYGRPDEIGLLHHPGPIRSITHLLMKGRGRSEVAVVHALWGLETCLAVIVIAAVLI